MREVLFVAGGGAVGAVLRYGLNHAFVRWCGSSFPCGTLFVNVLGSLALGLLAGWSARGIVSADLRLLLGVGVMGALTTFSTYSLETFELFQDGRPGAAMLNLSLNVVTCLLAVGAGWRLSS